VCVHDIFINLITTQEMIIISSIQVINIMAAAFHYGAVFPVKRLFGLKLCQGNF